MFFNNNNSPSAEICIIHNIVRDVILIALGLENRLYVDDLEFHLRLEDFKPISQQDSDIHDVIATEPHMTIREFVRLTFAEVGIEIEFCGKGQLEKGVIIDIDEEQLSLLHLNKENIKFGHTVVKVNDRNAETVESLITMEFGIEDRTTQDQPIHDLQSFIKDLVITDLNIMRK
ncbi:hypothetical protein SF1_06410 [Sphingobacterium faecium NBRC 15299]|jgi:GDP-D-mannose dehydratase|uniref:GDP-mannose 4,6-dehydratase n=1 Tax=Sphingobacterium faecium TaxID=34087 RepID=UPI000D3A3D06|nr:GDP-mannose 4,6-dehydratase [Sphingobacterium faecium]PTX10783.1 GDP-mannose 4,6 dehydratase [Sphingobacterium faecium]GEM62659.1 hypothetical protein SF1_06410 [Sphingobacterium faecium NBRC 15299]